jgi:alkylation response protein AidB-like acyl-CoA dehydrogenase
VDLELTDEQVALRAAALDFIERRITWSRLTAGSLGEVAVLERADWSEMAELGWIGLTVSTELGGAGGAPMDGVVLMEALGSGPLPGPVIETAVIVPSVLAALSGNAVASDLLGAVCRGEVVATLAIPSSCGLPPTSARHTLWAESGRVIGHVAPVRDAAGSTHLIADVRTAAGHALAIIDLSAGVSSTRLRSFPPRQYALDIDAAAFVIPLDDAALRAVAGVLMNSVPALCAFQLGSLQTVLDMSLRYANERVQFGKTIGSFQRVQDHVIEIVNRLDSARWATYYAACQVERDGAAAAAHVAKATIAESHFAGCDAAHEVHAGIGVDVDYGLAMHTYLSRDFYAYLGDPRWHRRRLVDELDLRDGVSR